MRYVEHRRHTMRKKPGQHLSQAGVDLARRVGEGTGPFGLVITSSIPRAIETAIAMGYAVDAEDELLSRFGDILDLEVAWDAGFDGWGRAAGRSAETARAVERLAALMARIARRLADGDSALVISHGGVVEASTVGCLPDADHAAWGGACGYCEGVRLAYDGERFVGADILRVEGAPLS